MTSEVTARTDAGQNTLSKLQIVETVLLSAAGSTIILQPEIPDDIHN